MQIKHLNFWTKLRKWEYWPFEVFYIPIFFYWFYLSLKARSFFFFSAANPSIETGGMLGESKFSILKKIDNSLKPKTLLIQVPINKETVIKNLQIHNIIFPFIAKPDVGERGWMVEKIHNESELEVYLGQMKAPFLIQEYIDYPIELGLFYYRFPDQSKGKISSIVMKEFLCLKGDGISTLRDLIIRNERARLQYEVLQVRYKNTLEEVLGKDEERTLVYIGNHCRGTKFLNGNHLINQQLTDVFDTISTSIDGFYYGRFDLRCKNLEDLYRGKDIKILELNGAGAEPAHIYDPDFSFLEAYQVLFHHWSVLYQISKTNYLNGVNYMTLKEGYASIVKLRNYRKLMKAA